MYCSDIYQYDNNIPLLVTGKFPSGYTWRLFIKHDNNMTFIDLTQNGGLLEGNLTSDILCYAGVYEFQLEGKRNDFVKQTNIVEVGIKESIIGEGNWNIIPSSYREYESALTELAEDAEAWAVGTRNGIPVTEIDPAYNNNARYWAELSIAHSVDARFTYEQTEPAMTWYINHNLKKHPAVTIVDNEDVVTKAKITYMSDYALYIEFNQPFTGFVYLN